MGFKKGNKLGVANKGRARTPEWSANQRKAKLGKHYSPATEYKKGSVSWTKINGNPKAKNLPHAFKKGQIPWNYIGADIPLYRKIRTDNLYRLWRSDVFHRDNFTCVICDKRGGDLNADHNPKLFSVILKEYKIDSLEKARACAELWDINNGRTLCVPCHKQVTFKKI